jgi:hypothetical protein
MEIFYNRDYIEIFAPKNSGKTYFMKALIKTFKKVIILDTNGEYADTGLKTIEPKEYSNDYLDMFLNEEIRTENNFFLVIDDIDVYNPSKSQELKKLLANSRHKGMGMGIISRRPKRIDAVLIMNANYLLLGYPLILDDIYYIEGAIGFKIDKDKFNSLKQYEFLLIDVKNRTQEKVKV